MFSSTAPSQSAACPACGESRARPSSAGGGDFEGFNYQVLSCRECGTKFVDPMPTARILEQMYSPAYVDEHYGGHCDQEPEEVASTADLVLRLRPSGSLLDVGCGAGAFLLAAHRRGLRAEGFELNDLSAKRTSMQTGLVVHSGSIERVTGRYDVVHLADVLEHLSNPLETLQHVVRLVGNQGAIVARGPLEAQPNLFDVAMRVRRRSTSIFRAARSAVPPWHLILFSLNGWRALAMRAGLHSTLENVSESQWPAAQNGLKGTIKRYSKWVSTTPVGRLMKSGNRVLSVWERH